MGIVGSFRVLSTTNCKIPNKILFSEHKGPLTHPKAELQWLNREVLGQTHNKQGKQGPKDTINSTMRKWSCNVSVCLVVFLVLYSPGMVHELGLVATDVS